MTRYAESCPANLNESPDRLLHTLLQMGRRWIEQQRLKSVIKWEREQLSKLSDEMLRDIGIDRATADEEAKRCDIPVGREH